MVKALKSPHEELPLGLLCGFDIVGDIPATGVYPKAAAAEQPTPIGSLDHERDNRAMMNRMAAEWKSASGAKKARIANLLLMEVLSQKAIDKGYASFTTEAELNRESGSSASAAGATHRTLRRRAGRIAASLR